MKKILSLITVVFLTSCVAYKPLYGELGDKMQEIGLKEVKMKHVSKDAGERRPSQIMYYKLKRIFSNSFDNDYLLSVELEPNESAIATRSDDTDKRKGLYMKALMTLSSVETGEEVFKITLSRSTSYTVQDEPFATQAARDKALESITLALSNDIIQRAALWFRGLGHENNN